MRLDDVRRANSIRWIPFWMAYGGLTASLVMGASMPLALGEDRSVGPWAFVFSAWSGVAAFLLFGKIRARCSVLELGLPVSARSLWLVHVTSVGIAGAFVAATSVFLIEVVRRVLPSAYDAGPDPSRLLLLVLSGLALAIAFLEMRRPELGAMPGGLAFYTHAGVVVVAVGVVLWLLADAAPAWALLPAVAAAAIGAHVYRALPAAFLVAPSAVTPAGEDAGASTIALPRSEREAGATSSGAKASARFVTARSLARLLYGNSREVFTLVLLIGLGALVGSALRAGSHGASDRQMQYFMILISISILYSSIPMRMDSLRFVDHLPISRNLLLAALLLPSLFAFSLGYGSTLAILDVVESRVEHVRLVNSSDGGVRVRVPLRHLAFDLDGELDPIESAWGEQHAPRRWSMMKGRRPVLYSPFSVRPESSRRFVADQLARAVEAVYGESIPSEELAARYLETLPDGTLHAVHPMSLRGDYPELAPRPGGPLAFVVLAMVIVPWLGAVGFGFRSYFAGGESKKRIATYWIVSQAFMVVLIVFLVLVVRQTIALWLIPALIEIPVHRIGQSLPATIATLIVLLAITVIACRFVRNRFQRTEIPRDVTKYSIVDWARASD